MTTEPNLAVAQRRRTAAIAGHQNDENALRGLAQDDDASVRATVLGGLTRAGVLTADDLRQSLADPAPAVRRRALEIVAELTGSGPASDVSILPLLDDADLTVVETAAWACGEREPAEPGAVTRLSALATEAADALIRESAVAALGSIGDETGLSAILAATQDKATVRRRAIIALAPFDGVEVDEAYERAKSDRDWQVRQAAEDLADPV